MLKITHWFNLNSHCDQILIPQTEEDITEVNDLSKCKDPIKKLIAEWCLDDKGVNLLYKNNGDERYPDFKLYKMIARHVHNHTPQKQLDRPEFKQFLVNKTLF